MARSTTWQAIRGTATLIHAIWTRESILIMYKWQNSESNIAVQPVDMYILFLIVVVWDSGSDKDKVHYKCAQIDFICNHLNKRASLKTNMHELKYCRLYTYPRTVIRLLAAHTEKAGLNRHVEFFSKYSFVLGKLQTDRHHRIRNGSGSSFTTLNMYMTRSTRYTAASLTANLYHSLLPSYLIL